MQNIFVNLFEKASPQIIDTSFFYVCPSETSTSSVALVRLKPQHKASILQA